MILESGLCEVSRHLTQRTRGGTWGEGEDLGANMSWLLHIEVSNSPELESPAKMIGEQFGGNFMFGVTTIIVFNIQWRGL